MTIDRALRRPRGVALAFGMTVAGIVVALNLLPVEQLQAFPGWFILLPLGLYLFLPLLYVAMFWSAARTAPAGFRIDRHRGRPAFAVPSHPLFGGLMFMNSVFAASNFATQPATRELFDGSTFVVVQTLAVLFAALLVGLGIWHLYRVGPVRLTSDGVVRPLVRTIAWDNLAPDGPSRRSIQNGKLWLLTWFRAPDSPQISYQWYSIDLRASFVNREFLAIAIRYYRDHPEARAQLGTADGLQQLLAVIAGARPTSPAPPDVRAVA